MNAKRISLLAAILTCALVFPFAFAQSPDATGSSLVRAHLEYSVLVPTAATDVIFSTYVFSNFSAQSVTFNSSDAYSVSTDAYGNEVLSYHYAPTPGQANKITIDALTNVSYDPSSYVFEPVKPGVDYLSQSRLVIVDSQIVSLANSISSKANSTEETVAVLSSWVYENIVYDSKYKDAALDSATTLAVGRGTCDEKAHLLEALLRARGIPARHAVGFAYSGVDWQPHAWVEAAINGVWVPVDPTFNEIFFIDATHLRLAVGRDQDDTKYLLKATGTSDLSGTKVGASSNFSFESQSAYSPFFVLSASFPEGTYHASERGTINATVRNVLSRSIAVPLYLSLYPDFSSISPRDQILVIGPGSKAYVSWDVIYPYQVSSGYSYNYSSAVSAYGYESKGYLLASQSGPSQGQASLTIESLAAKELSDGVQLYFWVRNSGNAAVSDAVLKLTVTDSDFTKTIRFLDVGNSTRVDFLVPYSLASNPRLLNANLSVKIGDSITYQEISVDLSGRPSAAPTTGGFQNDLSAAFLTPQFVAAAIVVVFMAMLLAYTVRKRKNPKAR